MYGLRDILHYALFGSLLANNTAPTMADSSKIEDTSNGKRNSLNSTLPKFLTNPKFCACRITGSDRCNALVDPTRVTNKHIPPITPIILSRFDFNGSESLFKFSSINTNRNKTRMAPM